MSQTVAGKFGLGLREESKRDSSTAQADSFADERGEKASACCGGNDRLVAGFTCFGPGGGQAE